MNTTFSILIPAYKATFLYECVKSVLQQDYSNFEIIILNDCSPEPIDEIVHSFSDNRIRYFKNEYNVGAIDVVDNWNKCLSMARGDYVICMGDDDCLTQNCLQTYAHLINENPGIGLLHGWTEIIDEQSHTIELTTQRCLHESAISLLWHRWNAYHLQFIGDFCFDRKWLNSQKGFFKLPLAWMSDDITAIIGANKNGVVNTQNIVFRYRRNRQTISSIGNIKKKMEAFVLGEKWYREYLKRPTTTENDELYLKMIAREIDKHCDKGKAALIAADLKSRNILSLLYWLFFRKKYALTKRCFIYSLLYLFR